MADSFSNTTVRSFLEVDNPRPRVVGTSSAGVEGPDSKVAEEGRCGVAPVAVPGCLKMPKLSDFLWGWMLQDMVCPAETLTQRTRYDWTCLALGMAEGLILLAYLAMDFDVLHARHDCELQQRLCVSCLKVCLAIWVCWTLLCLIAGGSHGRRDKNSGRFAGSSASGKLRGRAGWLAGSDVDVSGQAALCADGRDTVAPGAGGRVFAQTPGSLQCSLQQWQENAQKEQVSSPAPPRACTSHMLMLHPSMAGNTMSKDLTPHTPSATAVPWALLPILHSLILPSCCHSQSAHLSSGTDCACQYVSLQQS
jgi:hypothetical protein